MPDAGSKQTGTIRWGIYHRDREWARETGDPCLAELTAPTKEEAEKEASLQGVRGPTGIWAHRLEGGVSQAPMLILKYSGTRS
jgi:hypothetical protein